MTNQELIQYIEKWNEDAEFHLSVSSEEKMIRVLEGISGQILRLEISLTHLIPFMKRLKEDKQLDFDYLFDMIGMDWGNELGIIYHLVSTEKGHRIMVSVKIPDRENPEVETMENLWKAAHLQEREIYDLFGIKFKGHSNLKRIFLTEDFKGYPLRKDYEDDYMIIRK